MSATVIKTSRPFLSYGRQTITAEDIDAVVNILKGERLTQGPAVESFEKAIADSAESEHCIACNSGTAALHLAYLAAGVGSGDEVIVPAVTFAATAAAARFLGAEARIVDISPTRHTIDPARVLESITPRTKAIVAVDLAGQPADADRLREIASAHGLAYIHDAAHSLGSSYKGFLMGGRVADLVTFSFHPVKHITTGEGGAVVTNNAEMAERMRLYRSHGIIRDGDAMEAASAPGWYEIHEYGHNYRMPDINAALGESQVKRLPDIVRARRDIAAYYRKHLRHPLISLPSEFADSVHAYHLFQIGIDFKAAGISRVDLMNRLTDLGIGTQVHYIPLYRLKTFRDRYRLSPSAFPVAEALYASTLSIPCYPGLTHQDLDRVVDALLDVLP